MISASNSSRLSGPPSRVIRNEVTTLNEEEINMRYADESPEVPPVSQPLTPPVIVEEAAVVSKTGPTPLIMPVVERVEYDASGGAGRITDNYAGVRSATSSRIPSIPIS